MSSAAERPTSMRQLVLAALLVITAVSYVQRNCIGTAEKIIRESLGLSRGQSGDILAAFFLVYALFQLPSGWVAQRWGARAALSFYSIGWSLVLAACALAEGPLQLVNGRLALGAFQAGIFPCATLILASWYPASQRGFASALLNSFMLAGGAVGSVVTGLLLTTAVGWRGVFVLYALPGVLWGLCFAVWFRNRPEESPGVNPAELALIQAGRPPPQPSSERPPIPWALILLNVPLILVCMQQFCRAGASRFYDNVITTYFLEGREGAVKDVAVAGVLTSFPLLAGIVGGMVGGILSDWVLARTGSRRAGRQGVAVASLVAGSLCFVMAYFIANVWVATLVFSFGAFITTFASPCSYALTMDIGGKHIAVVFSLMNMAGNLGAAAFLWLTPRLTDWYGGWDVPLALFAGLHVVAALCWVAFNPEGTIGEPPPSNSPKE